MSDRRFGHLTAVSGEGPYGPAARSHGGGGSTGVAPKPIGSHEVASAARSFVDTVIETGMILPPGDTPIGAALTALCDAVETEMAQTARLGLDLPR